ncbi:glycosyltransferase family 2 protein [Candidatus Gottesmanbacteria bacterium]|nr:glycosyltransferase family 2 protein [Candidatus Gottesmanbacteria bacterium]
MKQTISAIILTKNEEKTIQKCLQSLSWCDEIIVVDDFSEDKTIDNCQLLIANSKNKNSKIKIYQRGLRGDFAAQRDFGLEKATSDWVLFIDVDEEISNELKNEILSICHPEFISGSNEMLKQVQHDTKGYYIKRKDYFLGKWLKYGETGNIKFVRLARKDAGSWAGEIHEEWRINGKIGKLKNPILHFPHPAISSFLPKINYYTDILAQKWYREGRKIHFLEILIFPMGKFLQNYILRLGFLDGIPGLIMAIMMSFHSFLARGKLWLLSH